MTSVEPTEIEGLSGRVLRIIGGYEMGASLKLEELWRKTVSAAPSPETVAVPDGATSETASYDVAR